MDGQTTVDSTPKISVVIYSYNFARYLGECIESVLLQTLAPFEIIICDDCSLDNSWEIISQYSQRYPELIRAYRHKSNIGPARNGNFGLKKVEGNLVSLLDGDDRWLPLKLELEWKALQEHPNAQVAYSNVYTIDAEGNRTGIWHDGKHPFPPDGDVFVEVFSKRFFPGVSKIFRNHLRYRYTLDETGYVDENLESHWDWDLKIRLASQFHVIYTQKALVEYRDHNEGFHRREEFEKLFGAMVAIYEKNLPLLSQRSKLEAAKVTCSLESFFALRQSRFPLAKRLNSYSLNTVYEKNQAQLDQLPRHDRSVLEEELAFLFGQLACQLAREAVEEGNRKRAFKYWRDALRYNPKEFGLRLAIKNIIPQWVYSRLRVVVLGLITKIK